MAVLNFLAESYGCLSFGFLAFWLASCYFAVMGEVMGVLAFPRWLFSLFGFRF